MTTLIRRLSKYIVYNVNFVIYFSVSIKRLRHALHLVIQKHAILHTSYFVDPETKEWWQQIEPLTNEGFSFVSSYFNSDKNTLEQLLQQERLYGLHDLKHGQVVRLHVVHKQDKVIEQEDNLVEDDIVIINIRHEVIDGTSLQIFSRDWANAYAMQELSFDANAPTYLDYAMYMKQFDSSDGSAYWKKLHSDFNVVQHVSRLPLRTGYV